MKRNTLVVWLCLEWAVAGAAMAQAPSRPAASPAPITPGAVGVAGAPAAGAPAVPAPGGVHPKGGGTSAATGTGTVKKHGAQNTARGRAGVTPTVIVDPNVLAAGSYGGNAVQAPQAPIPSPFPASARGKDGRNVITTETVTSDSVR